jgi:hypothetical protein
VLQYDPDHFHKLDSSYQVPVKVENSPL